MHPPRDAHSGQKQCAFCGNTTYRTVYQDEQIDVVRCQKCKLVQQMNYAQAVASINNSFDSVESYYQKRSVQTGRKLSFSQKKARLTSDICEELVTNLSPGASVLDVGCGTGELIYSLHHGGLNVIGLEPDPANAEFVKDQLTLPVMNDFYRSDLYPSDSFDCITFIQVLEHVERPYEAFGAAYKHLKPNGILVVEVPSYNNPRILAYRLTRRRNLVQRDFIPAHNYYYTPDTLAAFVSSAGFRNIRIRTGRYSIKYGSQNTRAWQWIDRLTDALHIGGILLYAQKPSSTTR